MRTQASECVLNEKRNLMLTKLYTFIDASCRGGIGSGGGFLRAGWRVAVAAPVLPRPSFLPMMHCEHLVELAAAVAAAEVAFSLPTDVPLWWPPGSWSTEDSHWLASFF